jgi:hypothetical protein
MALGSTQSLVKMCTRYIPGGKGGRCVRLTTSTPSCAECHEIWEPKPPGTLWATPGPLRDSFTFTSLKDYYIIFQTPAQNTTRPTPNPQVQVALMLLLLTEIKMYKHCTMLIHISWQPDNRFKISHLIQQDWYVSICTVPPWVLCTPEFRITLTKPEQYQVQLYY